MKTGLYVRFANNNDETLDEREMVFVGSGKKELEQVMSKHFQKPTTILFIDVIDNRDNGDTRITIEELTYHAFTTVIQIQE